MAGRGNKNYRMCSVPGQLEAVLHVIDSLDVRFCAAPSAEFTSYLSIREQPVTAVAIVFVRNILRLCMAMLDC